MQVAETRVVPHTRQRAIRALQEALSALALSVGTIVIHLEQDVINVPAGPIGVLPALSAQFVGYTGMGEPAPDPAVLSIFQARGRREWCRTQIPGTVLVRLPDTGPGQPWKLPERCPNADKAPIRVFSIGNTPNPECQQYKPGII